MKYEPQIKSLYCILLIHNIMEIINSITDTITSNTKNVIVGTGEIVNKYTINPMITVGKTITSAVNTTGKGIVSGVTYIVGMDTTNIDDDKDIEMDTFEEDAHTFNPALSPMFMEDFRSCPELTAEDIARIMEMYQS